MASRVAQIGKQSLEAVFIRSVSSTDKTHRMLFLGLVTFLLYEKWFSDFKKHYICRQKIEKHARKGFLTYRCWKGVTVAYPAELWTLWSSAGHSPFWTGLSPPLSLQYHSWPSVKTGTMSSVYVSSISPIHKTTKFRTSHMTTNFGPSLLRPELKQWPVHIKNIQTYNLLRDMVRLWEDFETVSITKFWTGLAGPLSDCGVKSHSGLTAERSDFLSIGLRISQSSLC